MKQKVQEGKSYTEYVAITREEITNLLTLLEIPHRYVNIGESGFSRQIEFEVGECTYKIIWYSNECTLLMGADEDAPFFVFRQMYHNTSHPRSPRKHGSLCFCYDIYVVEGMFDSAYPYESLYLPLQNVDKKS